MTTSHTVLAIPNQDPAGERTEQAIQEAIHDAAQLDIRGRDVTPYILKAVASKTGKRPGKGSPLRVKKQEEV